jgi:hypothetical protein
VIRRKGEKAPAQDMNADESFQSKSPVEESAPGTRVYEASSAPKYEMHDGRSDPVELPVDQRVVELDTNDKRERDRRRVVGDRANTGYDGAYRGN